MSDLIDRQAAIDALGDMPMSWADTDAEIQAQEDWKQHREALLKLPTAEKRGKWVEVYLEGQLLASRCTACGELETGVPLNYCPWCGARMEN